VKTIWDIILFHVIFVTLLFFASRRLIKVLSKSDPFTSSDDRRLRFWLFVIFFLGLIASRLSPGLEWFVLVHLFFTVLQGIHKYSPAEADLFVRKVVDGFVFFGKVFIVVIILYNIF
jgi:hypothetical protein